MKKIVLPIFSLLIIVSCKKTVPAEPTIENSSQQLVSVTKTADYSVGVAYPESVSYEYNNAGKIITEGSKHYYRDDKERIVQITDPNTITNRDDIRVYYNDRESGNVAYTMCKMNLNLVESYDSVVYLHDDNNRLVKMTSYFSENGASPFLSHYNIFGYDRKGNIAVVDIYNVNNGIAAHCGHYEFSNYDDKVNPQHTVDEVRLMNIPWDVMNVSANNFASVNRYNKVYQYRADGRPRSCSIIDSGKEIFQLTFEYK